MLSLAGLAACVDPLPVPPDGGADAAVVTPLPEPTGNDARGIDDTALEVDLSARAAVARVTFAPSADAGATLETGDLAFDAVLLDGEPLKYAAIGGGRLLLGLPASRQPLQVELRYRWSHHEGFTGASSAGYTLTWPYWCGNLFPCHSHPEDGTTFSLALTGVPAGRTAVYPARIAAEAPAYQLGWSVAEYTELPLGRTDAGTELVAWYQPGQEAVMVQGTAHLVAVFEWFERTLGPYPFGPRAGPVAANWGPVNGGMEHHPYWHMGSLALGSADTHAHEAAHGWFGDGVRLQCWEDFVLSEGTATYLAARALEVVAPDAGVQQWEANAAQLTAVNPMDLVWPEGCGQVDVLNDRLFTRAPYLRGAFFLRAVAQRVGPQALDFALSAFYGAHRGQASRMTELLRVIHVVTGFDPTACAERWLRSTTIPPLGPCPG